MAAHDGGRPRQVLLYMTFVREWNPIRMQSDQLPHVTEFKYMLSTLQNDGDMNTEETRGHSVNGITGGRCQASYAP